MRSVRRWGPAVLFAVAAPLLAHHTDVKPVVEQPWVREVIPGQSATAAYLVIKSHDHEPDVLLGATCDAAGSVELHTMKTQGGTMRMKKLDRLALPARGTIALAPGGDHLMLFGLKRPLRSGERVRLTLNFQRAGKVEVEALVRRQGLEHDAQH